MKDPKEKFKVDFIRIAPSVFIIFRYLKDFGSRSETTFSGYLTISIFDFFQIIFFCAI